MGLLLDPEHPSVLLHHHTEIDVERRGVSRQGVIERVLHIAACIFIVGRVNMRPDIFRIKVFDRVEASVVVHLGLAPAVLVNDNHPRHAEVGGHLLVVGSESRSDVDDSGTVLRGHIVTGDHLERLSLIGRLEPRDQLLGTTTPWTLPSNTALCVGPRYEYVRVLSFNPYTGNEAIYVLAKDLLNVWFNPKAADIPLEDYKPGDKLVPFKVLDGSFKGADLVGIRYKQLIPWFKPATYSGSRSSIG